MRIAKGVPGVWTWVRDCPAREQSISPRGGIATEQKEMVLQATDVGAVVGHRHRERHRERFT
jgi:hypothetical protein